MFHQAFAQQQQGRLAEAEALYREVLARAPEAVDAWVNHGVTLHGLGRLREALASYDQALARIPAHGLAWHNRALVLLGLGQHEGALESFDKTLAHAPRHADAWRGRARALFALGRSAEALESLYGALDIAPDHLDTMYQCAALLHIEQRFGEALAVLDRILGLDADYPQALALKGALLCEIRRAPEGMTCYRRHAEAVYSKMPVTEATDSEPKKKHDAEQRAWRTAQGIPANGFHLEEGARIAGPAVNPANAGEVQRRWRESNPQIVVVDKLLTEAALAALRRFCWGSSIWRRSYPNGYLGAAPQEGFSCPLLAQIADELRTVFPAVIADHGLGLMWGFKYDSRLSGIPVHADQAKVNVNFWIAPEDASRDPKSGGLVVWDVKAPLNWDFSRYNGDETAINAFLAKSGAKSITIPHRANRAVIFDSDLFHATDEIDFREGYENRRVNVTMLYGRRTFRGS
jgi:tetratricopeptide (TPR) repeat protein